MTLPALTILTVIPAIAGLALLCASGRAGQSARWIALSTSLISLLAAIVLWRMFNPTLAGMQFQERQQWIAMLGVDYHVGIDGLGLLMLLLTSIVVPIGICASWQIEDRPSLYFSFLLLLEACLFGTFTALNFFHWFFFWELSLIPAFFLIKLWGGPRSTHAATQFLVYAMVGSVAMLLGFIAIFQATGQLDFVDLAGLAQSGTLIPAIAASLHWGFTPEHAATLVFAGIFLGFAVKIPIVPFHTWLPAAYAEAPTGATILLTGAMSKMGLYGLLRIVLPLFGAEMHHWMTPLLWLSVASIVLPAYAALRQHDLKRIFAYSSINHLGYCVLAITAIVQSTHGDPAGVAAKYTAMDGVFLQIFNHALTAAVLFWFVAMIEKRSSGVRGIGDFGGLRTIMPVFTGLMGIALFSSLGLPGLNGFVGEFLIFKGTFPLVPWATAISTIGLLVTAIFLLGILQKVFSGPLNQRWIDLPDLSIAERLTIAPAIALIFLLGFFPELLLRSINGTAIDLVQRLRL